MSVSLIIETIQNPNEIIKTLWFGLIHMMRAIYGPCEDLNFSHMWYCLPFLGCNTIFSETLHLMMILPLIFLIVFPYVQFYIIIIAYIGSVITALVIAVVTEASQSALWIICNVLSYAIVLYIYQRQHLQLFLFTKRYQRIVDARDRDRRSRDMKLAEEMRNMVASISHDMKSVSYNIFTKIAFF